MNKKYQVFISSTFKDLKDQRAMLVNATLKAGHFPVGMEYFAAGGTPKWEYITRLIDTSDYYVVIIADWYGSTVEEEGGISYTEKEFDYAVAKGLKPIVLPLASDAKWGREHAEPNAEKRKRLDSFKAKAGVYMAGLWKDDQGLMTEFLTALSFALANDPREGWVRASEALSPQTAQEIARLSKENSDYRTVLEAMKAQPESDREFVRLVEQLESTKSDFFADGRTMLDFFDEIKLRYAHSNWASHVQEPKSPNFEAYLDDLWAIDAFGLLNATRVEGRNGFFACTDKAVEFERYRRRQKKLRG